MRNAQRSRIHRCWNPSALRLVREGALEELCATEQRYRARFAPGFDGAALQALGFTAQTTEGSFTCEAEDPAALNAKIAAALQSGALLVELSPDVRDLEDVLTEALGS